MGTEPTSVICSCVTCGAALTVRRMATGGTTCPKCARAEARVRRRRVLDGTATVEERAVYDFHRAISLSRRRFALKCADCETVLHLAVRPVGDRRCRPCSLKVRWGGSVRLGRDAMPHLGARVDASLLARLRAAAAVHNTAISVWVESAVALALAQFDATGRPPEPYRPATKRGED